MQFKVKKKSLIWHFMNQYNLYIDQFYKLGIKLLIPAKFHDCSIITSENMQGGYSYPPMWNTPSNSLI